MKKILILLATICCCGCSSVETKATSTTETTKIKYYRNDIGGHIYSVEVEGHLYIVFGASHGGGIIHAEHCPCKNKTLKEVELEMEGLKYVKKNQLKLL